MTLERGPIDTNVSLKQTSSGLVGSFKYSAQQVRLGRYSIKLLDELTKDGFDVSWDQRGALHLARTHDRMIQFRKMKSQSLPWEINCKLMSTEECKEKCGVIFDEDIKGGLFIHDDGVVDKDKLRQVLLAEAVKGGVTVVENCGVEKILQTNHRVDAVETTRGTIECVYFVSKNKV